jgi:arsenate reductase
VDFDQVDYTKEPFSREELDELLSKMGMTAREMLRTREPVAKELGLKDPSVTDDALLDAMVAHPGLIQRPIAVKGERAVLGRPPERVLEIAQGAS